MTSTTTTTTNLSPLSIESEAYKNFINSIDSEATKKAYRFGLFFFMKYCNLDEQGDYGGLLLLTTTLADKQKLEDKIRDYITWLKVDKQLSSNSINLYVAAIAHFYTMNNVVLNWKRLSKFKGKKRMKVEDKPYTKEQIRQLLDFSDLRLKCIILLMCSAGLRRGAIPSLRVGDLEKKELDTIPNSRYISAQNTSGRSLIGVVDKFDDGYYLRLGVAVLARNAICTVNEIGFMPPEDQGHLNDIAEEGKTTLTKYAMSFNIDAPTTIIAISNQFNTDWNDPKSISKDEIPLLKTLVDRSDQIYAFRDDPSDPELEEYAKQKTRFRKRKLHNYNFLKKLIMHQRTLNPQFAKGEEGREIENRLNQFWINARKKDVATNRTYDSIFRLAEAQAKLNLSSEITDDIATQTMESISLMLSQYGRTVKAVKSPKDAVYDMFLHILKESKAAISVEELKRIACEENKHISAFR